MKSKIKKPKKNKSKVHLESYNQHTKTPDQKFHDNHNELSNYSPPSTAQINLI